MHSRQHSNASNTSVGGISTSEQHGLTTGGNGAAGASASGTGTGQGTGPKVMSPLRTVSLARQQGSPSHPPPPPAAWTSRSPAVFAPGTTPPGSSSLEHDRSSAISLQLSDISSDEDAEGQAGEPGGGSSSFKRGTGRPASYRRSVLLPTPGVVFGFPHAGIATPGQRSTAQQSRAPSFGGHTPLLGGTGTLTPSFMPVGTPASQAPPRPSRTHSTGRYPNLTLGGGSVAGGSISRSASRARHRERADDDDDSIDRDDEVAVRDRGEDLIRKRMKERKRAKRIASRLGQVSSTADTAEGSLEGSQPADAAPTGRSPPLTPLVDARSPRHGRQQQETSGGRSASTSRAPSRTRGESAGSDARRESAGGYFPAYNEEAQTAGTGLGQSQSTGSSYLTASNLSEHDHLLSEQADETQFPPIDSAGNLQPPHSPAAVARAPKAPSTVGEVVEEVVREAEEEGGELEDDGDEGSDDSPEDGEEEGVTLRDRQDAINIEHPFGLPIWKPALYKKSRSITRTAETALHSIPSAAAERHLLPGNILWTVIFGWWLSVFCFAAATLVYVGERLGGGKPEYSRTLAGLAWYIGWPFGKYVSGDGEPKKKSKPSEAQAQRDALEDGDAYGSLERGRVSSESGSSIRTVRDNRTPDYETAGASRRSSAQVPTEPPDSPAAMSANDYGKSVDERQRLLRHSSAASYGAVREDDTGKPRSPPDQDDSTTAIGSDDTDSVPRNKVIARCLGLALYWPLLSLVIAPLMLFVCILCWGMVITIPMAKLTWALLKNMFTRPLEIHFKSAPKIAVPTPTASPATARSEPETGASGVTMRRARLKAGQLAPNVGGDDAVTTVLLCIYRAVGFQYYKYTIGGVNIMFVNLVPLVFFTIFDAFVLLPIAERTESTNKLFHLISSRVFIFVLSLASVIPLSYFIGMAVASISAQSSIGMGAVINATFGSIIEIILYGIALTQGKGRLVEGSIVGSILAGVLLMPGASMVSGAFKRKEQRFNAKSAGVTSTMLIMAIIGTLTPTLFYQTYGSFQLRCEGCPEDAGQGKHARNTTHPAIGTNIGTSEPWNCQRCYYAHPDPANDPFYQDQVETLMYFCATILLLSYLIGLWFSLKTHASQIWQNPQQLMKSDELPNTAALHPSHRATLYQRLTPQAVLQQLLPTHRDQRDQSTTRADRQEETETSKDGRGQLDVSPNRLQQTPAKKRHFKSAPQQTPTHESAPLALQSAGTQPAFLPMNLPDSITTEDFTRAVAHATVSALRQHASAAQRLRPLPANELALPEDADQGGHEAPSWSRGTSTAVLLACTLLYALIAEVLVDVVDVVLQGSGIDEKFLGLTLFALVPNTTEFMNAMSFALNGNIALSMEIGSAYALQVCLLQIPAMVAFSACWDTPRLGQMVDTFTLIFPRWDVISIVLAIFLLTYTYIEARSNYHRGSTLILSYLVLVAGFYFAPPAIGDGEEVIFPRPDAAQNITISTFQWITGLGT